MLEINSDEYKPKNEYAVFIKQEYIRDAQILSETESLNNEAFEKSIENDENWTDFCPKHLVCIINAKDENTAIDIVSEEHAYDKRILEAIDTKLIKKC